MRKAGKHEKDDDEHNLSRRGSAYDYVAHEPRLLFQVEKGVVVVYGKLPYREAYAVGVVVLKPALLDVEHLVEHTRYVESQRVAAVELLGRLQLLIGEPRPIRERELELVAVELLLGRPLRGQHLGQGNLADTGEVVLDLLPLELQLEVVGYMLPLAAAAHPEVFAKRLHPQRRIAVKFHDTRLGIAVLLARHL